MRRCLTCRGASTLCPRRIGRTSKACCLFPPLSSGTCGWIKDNGHEEDIQTPFSLGAGRRAASETQNAPREPRREPTWVEDKRMRWQQQWCGVLVAGVLVGLVGVTAIAAAGEQFLPVLSIREGALRFLGIPQADGEIAYLTLLNERDGGINGVQLVWEECETVYDVTRSIECYERLKNKGSTGAAVFPLFGTPQVSALLERATQDQIPLLAAGAAHSDAAEGRVFPYVF